MCAGESGWNTQWRVLNGEVVAPTACPKLFQVYSVRHGPTPGLLCVLARVPWHLPAAPLSVSAPASRFVVCWIRSAVFWDSSRLTQLFMLSCATLYLLCLGYERLCGQPRGCGVQLRPGVCAAGRPQVCSS